MGEICELENVLGASVPGVLFPVGKNSSLSFVLSRSVVSDSCEPVDCSPSGSSVHGTIQARILERLSLLQGIFQTQGSNPGLLHCRWTLYQLSHEGSPFKL